MKNNQTWVQILIHEFTSCVITVTVAVAVVMVADALDSDYSSSSNKSRNDSRHGYSNSMSTKDDTHGRSYQLQGILHRKNFSLHNHGARLLVYSPSCNVTSVKYCV